MPCPYFIISSMDETLMFSRTLEPSVPTFACVVYLGMADIPEIPDILDFLGGYGFLDDLGVLEACYLVFQPGG